MLIPCLCIVCEKVIFSKDDVASLVSLFTRININSNPGAEIPANAVIPKEWAIFSSWDSGPGDDKKDYFHCTKFIYPDGTQFGDVVKSRVQIQSDKRAQVAVQLNGFPIGQTGRFTIATWIEENEKSVIDPIEIHIDVARSEV
jgi:hypothetical protein